MDREISSPLPQASVTFFPLAVYITACTGRPVNPGYEAKRSEDVWRKVMPRVAEPARMARPSCVEASMFSPSKARNLELPYATEEKILQVPEFLAVQLSPSGEVRMVRNHPAATNWPAP